MTVGPSESGAARPGDGATAVPLATAPGRPAGPRVDTAQTLGQTPVPMVIGGTAADSPAPRRFCPVCEQVDDHPRHDFWLTDPKVAPHMDCCAERGCPDGSCDILIRNKAGATGNDFREQIIAQAEETQALLDERDERTRSFRLADLDPNVHGAVTAAPTQLNNMGGNA